MFALLDPTTLMRLQLPQLQNQLCSFGLCQKINKINYVISRCADLATKVIQCSLEVQYPCQILKALTET
jgi:hypothetical protein